jgi:hypothetical protein
MKKFLLLYFRKKVLLKSPALGLVPVRRYEGLESHFSTEFIMCQHKTPPEFFRAIL